MLGYSKIGTATPHL